MNTGVSRLSEGGCGCGCGVEEKEQGIKKLKKEIKNLKEKKGGKMGKNEMI